MVLTEGVKVHRAVQRAGDFVITFPKAYHMGFCHGFNIGEAVNFAHPDWIEEGAKALARYSQIAQPSVIAHESILCIGMRVVMLKLGVEQQAPHADRYINAFVERFQLLTGMIKQVLEAKDVKERFMTEKEVITCYFCKTMCHMAAVKCNCKKVGYMCLVPCSTESRCKSDKCRKAMLVRHSDWSMWQCWFDQIMVLRGPAGKRLKS